ncbi:MAG: hypothetical protein H6907_18455 [Hyphomicrobiales bacterium]|nr:hypothetical protein [Hyphomicrobiales bacterium]
MLVDSLIILAGVAVTIALAELVINNAIEMAERFRLSGTFIGMTVLSVGTSIPEVFTHVVGSATILRQPETFATISSLVIGANIGSDIFQQNFILPLIGLLGAILIKRQNLFSEIGALVWASVLVWLFGLGGLISRLEGALLLLAYVGYILFLAKRDRVRDEAPPRSRGGPEHGTRRTVLAVAIIAISFAVMAVATEQVVVAATRLVENLPLSASFFGVIFLGVATALPELTTSLVSIHKGEKNLSVGIVVGSNITNPLLGIGLGAVISTYAVPDVVVYYDLPVKIVTSFFIFYFLWTQELLRRWESLVLIAMCLAYLVARAHFFPSDF